MTTPFLRRIALRGWKAAGFCLALLCATSLRLAAEPPHLTIEKITLLPTLSGTAPRSPVWSPDSRRLAFLWNDHGMAFGDVWIVDANGAEPRRITDTARVAAAASAAARPARDPLEVRGEIGPELVREAMARVRGGVSEVIWTADSRALVFNMQGQIFRVQADGSNLTRLTQTPASRHAIALSPDNSVLSFLQGGDLWFMKLPGGEPMQVTHSATTGAGAVMTQGVTSYKWSPNGRYVALLFEDHSKERKALIVNYLALTATPRAIPRGYPGDQDDAVESIVVYRPDGGGNVSAKIEGAHRNITGYDWSPDNRRVMVDQVAFNAVDRWLYLVAPEDGTAQEIWHDTRATRTSPFWSSLWQGDGEGVLFTTNVDGWYHLWWQPVSGGKPRLLTPGDYSVVGDGPPIFPSLAPGSGQVFFVSTHKSPAERQVYRVSQSGGPVEQVTTLPGTYIPHAAPDGATLAVLHSNDVTPVELYLIDVKRKSPERRITHSPLKEFYSYPWVQPRYVTFQSRVDGVTLHGRLIEPPNLDRSKKYPAILGPVYRDTVRNMWRDRYALLQQYLAIEGRYIELQVDVRGSTCYGREFEEQFLQKYGQIDIDDLESGVDFLNTLPYVDPGRVGIWGNSYGGLLTLDSVFKKPGVYKAAVAGAPASNAWHATSTQTRLGRDPSSDGENYRVGSPISFGENLQDHLMIIQGIQDETVLFGDTATLAEKLIHLGKMTFDLVVLPGAGHGWVMRDDYARYGYGKMVEHFDRYLGRGPR